MHTFHGQNKTLIQHNSDLSGNIIISVNGTDKEIEVNGNDIVDFVINHLRDRHIAKLQDMDRNALIKFCSNT